MRTDGSFGWLGLWSACQQSMDNLNKTWKKLALCQGQWESAKPQMNETIFDPLGFVLESKQLVLLQICKTAILWNVLAAHSMARADIPEVGACLL